MIQFTEIHGLSGAVHWPTTANEIGVAVEGVGGKIENGGLAVIGWVMVLRASSDTSLINLHILCRSARQDAVN